VFGWVEFWVWLMVVTFVAGLALGQVYKEARRLDFYKKNPEKLRQDESEG